MTCRTRIPNLGRTVPAAPLVLIGHLLGLVSAAQLTGCASSRTTVDPVYFPPAPASPHVVHIKSFNRLYDLVPVRGTILEILRGGRISPFVRTPAGIAFRDGHLYTCDTGINVVHDWDLATGKAKRLGQSGKTVLAKPVAVAADEAGNIYVADTGRGEVVVFDPAGHPTRKLHPPDRDAYRPISVAVAESTLCVADIAAHEIDVFSANDGAFVGSFGGVGTDPGRFYYPMGVAAGPSGRILVSDSMNSRVQVFDAARKPVLSMGKPGNRYGDMGKPRHLAVGPDGVVFVADVAFAHIHLFDERGRLLMLMGGPEDRPGGTPMPTGVAVAESLPDHITALVPEGFRADYYLFVTNSIATKHISLFAVGTAR